MKKTLACALVASLVATASAEVIKQWDFNSKDLDGFTTTGTLVPYLGGGTPAATVGGVGNRFGGVSGNGSTDPNTLDNSQWRIGSNEGGDSFPAFDQGNKTTGVEFRVNASGYNNISMTWDQENSASASKYWRVQYTTNGVDWVDHTTVITALPTGPDADGGGTPFWQTGLSANFSGLPGVDNNPDFGVRLVSEFEFTATGSGTNAYVGNRGNYGIGGTLWLDMVTFSGDDSDPSNQRPTISAIPDYSTLVSNAIPAFAFEISDAETPADNLQLSAISSNPSLVHTFSFEGTGTVRTLSVTPEPGQSGVAVITVRVKDGGNKVTETSFYLTIAAPSIVPIFSQQTTYDVPLTVSFTVTNMPGDPALWVLTGTSSNTNRVPNSGIEFGGSGNERTVTLTPINDPANIGDSSITITVASEGRQATASFNLRLLPGVIVYYDLNSLPNNSNAVAVATTVAEGLTAANISRGPGIRAAPLTRGFSADWWMNPSSTNRPPKTPSRENALAGDYYQFSVDVQPGFTASIATLDVSLRRSALNAAMNFEWQYSLDGFATPGVTIVPQGPGWTAIGWEDTFFLYRGRTSGTAPTVPPPPYAYMTQDVPGRPNTTTSVGDPIPTIDLSVIEALQNLPAGTTVTFRLFAWGNAATVDSNTTALGRVTGPQLRGTVAALPSGVTLNVAKVGSTIQLSWPASANATLQSTASLTTPDWQTAPEPPTTQDGTNTVTIVNPTGNRFFRLLQ